MEASGVNVDYSTVVALQALAAGKPPPPQVGNFFFGRENELALLNQDLEQIDAGHSSLRIVVGEIGSGKSALLGEAMRRARAKRFVTMGVEISRQCLLHGRAGEGRGLLEHAVLSMRTLGSGDRLAMDAIVGTFGQRCAGIAAASSCSIKKVQREQLSPLAALPRGADFIRVIEIYSNTLELDDRRHAENAARWLCGQYDSTTESRVDLGVAMVTDDDAWAMFKLWAAFVRIAGKRGLILALDEARLMGDILTGPTRRANYAQLSRIFNEIFQGSVSGMGLLIAATPELLFSEAQGLSSEPSLRSWLSGSDAVGRAGDAVEPTAFKIADLSLEENFSLISRLRALLLQRDPTIRTIEEAQISSFIEQSRDYLGGQEYPLPRPLIRQFLTHHNTMANESGLDWNDISGSRPNDPSSYASVAAASGQFAKRSM